MGFMDKAKKLAEQAQEKLDEAQKNFNKPQTPDAQQGDGVRYDEHGRPIRDETPAAATAPPSATPAPDPAAESAGTPAEEAAPPPPPPAQGGPAPGSGTNATPDPFKPIDQ